mgnify:CR=1 FL=1|tara:strand:+ start:77 stop:442 length:366 start_codon:yes stop_codon:yes gene_type:complete
MDYKIYKINNGYKVGRKDGQRLGEAYDNRLYITKKPMKREGAKRLLCKLEMAEKGMVMKVKSKKKRLCDGFMRIDPIKSKKKKQHNHNTDTIDFVFDELIFWPTLLKIGKKGTIGTSLNYI